MKKFCRGPVGEALELRRVVGGEQTDVCECKHMFVMGLRSVCGVEPVGWRLGVSGRVEAYQLDPPAKASL